jgi:hypothetical protein
MDADQPNEPNDLTLSAASFQEPDQHEPDFVQAAGEDEADIAVGAASRALDEAQIESPVPVPPLPPSEPDEDIGAAVAAVAAATTPPSHAAVPDITVLQDYEREVHDLLVEMKGIEENVRTLLAERDPQRKRKLSGTHRWHELEEDIISWRFTGRFDEASLRRLQELIGRHHYLFRHLRFLAATRPVWNS